MRLLADRVRRVWALVLRGRPLLIHELDWPQRADDIRRAARSHPDLVLVEHVLVAGSIDLVRSVLPGVPIVLSEHDVDLHRTGSPLPGWSSRLSAPLARLDRRAWLRHERRAVRSADVAFVPTAADRDALLGLAPDASVQVVPFGVGVSGCAPSADRDPATLLYIGAFDHVPNVDAATRLAQRVFPRVRAAIPDARLLIVGRDPGMQVAHLAGSGVTVTGEVASVTDALCSSTLFVAPISRGAGTRVKILEALAHGIPVVTTTTGAAGTGAVPGRDLLVVDEADMAAEVIDLLRDPERAASLGASGRQLATDAAADGTRTSVLRSAIASALAPRPARTDGAPKARSAGERP